MFSINLTRFIQFKYLFSLYKIVLHGGKNFFFIASFYFDLLKISFFFKSTYIIFGISGIIMAVSVLIFYPETKGNSLEEMDNVFGNIYPNNISTSRQRHPPSSLSNESINIGQQRDLERGIPEEEEIS
jgi:hypothetical protein